VLGRYRIMTGSSTILSCPLPYSTLILRLPLEADDIPEIGFDAFDVDRGGTTSKETVMTRSSPPLISELSGWRAGASAKKVSKSFYRSICALIAPLPEPGNAALRPPVFGH
jgi:hypothetical protein